MLVERLARAAHIPSHIFKERNLYQRGLTTHYGQELADVENLHGVWNQCKSRVNLDERVEQATLFNEQNRYRKRGVALMPVKVGLGMRAGDFMFMSSALVHLYTDGTVLVTHGGVEMGQGLQTKCAQIAAETLGVPLENVLSPTTDTLVVANAQMTGASFGSGIHSNPTHSISSPSPLHLHFHCLTDSDGCRHSWPIGSPGMLADPRESPPAA